MATYILSGVVVFLLLVCALCLRAVWKAVQMNDHDEKQRRYLEKALKARGLWNEYQLAMRESWEMWGRDERADK
ncbi:hypothetical protein [Pseudomonas syringae]|uniref:hypothetical protein n=1 Tax=Pseudomonas syringae TaxID=317 RepID=UPI00200B0DE4|nr:hypothetical protein [Pseudomonas syringae]MCK9709871.1 hypothetical protein [Pseudomonas syringae pv. syringae]